MADPAPARFGTSRLSFGSHLGAVTTAFRRALVAEPLKGIVALFVLLGVGYAVVEYAFRAGPLRGVAGFGSVVVTSALLFWRGDRHAALRWSLLIGVLFLLFVPTGINLLADATLGASIIGGLILIFPVVIGILAFQNVRPAT